MVITRGRWSSASTSMLSVSACPQGDNLRLALLGSNRVTGAIFTRAYQVARANCKRNALLSKI